MTVRLTIMRRMQNSFGGPRVGAVVAATLCMLVMDHGSASAQTTAGHGANLADRDTTCAPCSDFYQYANGGWLATATIPGDRPQWTMLDQLTERTQAVLHAILDSLRVATLLGDTPEGKVGHFYANCMDSARAESDGVQPLHEELARIDGIASVPALRDEIARLHRAGIGAVFRLVAMPDFTHAATMIADLRQDGLGLPDRDYYFRADTVAERTREAYVAHVARLLVLSGVDPVAAATHARGIMALETTLADASMTLVERRNPTTIDHPMTVGQLGALTPAWSWPAYFRAVGRPDIATANVEQPQFLRTMDVMLRSVSLAEWKHYLRWRYISAAAPQLSAAFVQEDFRFAAVLTGTPELRPRWRRCLDETDRRLGEALGQVYVARTLPAEARHQALALVHTIELALREELSAVSWMSDSTRHQALAKLAAVTHKIAHPDRWRDYSALTVRQGPFWFAVLAAREFETTRQLATIGHPVDREEWPIPPQTVNAYYEPPRNEMVVPAGMLQPPFFDPKADAASNYGALGAVMGHELTHGFDDEGRKFDAAGNLRDWWTPADAAAYTQRAIRVAEQYSAYVAVDSIHVNGRLTLGENIADIGGLTLAYAAMEHALDGQPRSRIHGLTPEQRFFLAYAQILRGLYRPAALRTMAQTDVHAPVRWRVVGVVANMPAFAQAFGCRAGDPMVSSDSVRTRIW